MDPLQRIMSRTAPFVDCLIYTGLPRSRYGRISIDGVEVYVHRVVFEAAHGPIPEGLVVDHICFTTKCVNIDHLRLLDRVTNMLRHPAPHHHAVKTHCPQGHNYDSANTYVYDGRRSCRACHLQSTREHKQRARAAA